jgi:hypothetical protein
MLRVNWVRKKRMALMNDTFVALVGNKRPPHPCGSCSAGRGTSHNNAYAQGLSRQLKESNYNKNIDRMS